MEHYIDRWFLSNRCFCEGPRPDPFQKNGIVVCGRCHRLLPA